MRYCDFIWNLFRGKPTEIFHLCLQFPSALQSLHCVFKPTVFSCFFLNMAENLAFSLSLLSIFGYLKQFFFLKSSSKTLVQHAKHQTAERHS